jgi:uncharacterized protein YcgI (DUF1989 family)
MKSIDSQPRACEAWRALRLQVRRLERGHAAELLQVLGGLLAHHVDDVVDRDDALHAPVVVDHRHGQEVLLGEQRAHRLLVHLLVHRDDVRVHDVAHGAVRGAISRSRNDTTPSSRCCASST